MSNREANGTPGRWAGCAAPAARPGSWRRSFLRRSLAGSVASLMLAVTGLAITAVPASADGYDPAGDMNSMADTTSYSGATSWWNAGYTGAGVDVAVIDTGISPVVG